MSVADSSERIVPGRQVSVRQHLLLLRHQFAYEFVQRRLRASDRVVEIGCGAGYGAARLRERAASYVGVDVDPDAVAHARRENAGLDFRVYDGDRLPFEPATFDVAASFQVVEHVADDRRFVAEIARVLASGGALILTTPNRLTRVEPGRRPWNRYHRREYAPAELESLLRCSFAQVQILGVRGSAEVERIEHERLRSIRRIASIDVFGLRDRIPEWVRQPLSRWFERGSALAPPAFGRFGVADYRTQPGELERSLDLLAICRTGPPR